MKKDIYIYGDTMNITDVLEIIDCDEESLLPDCMYEQSMDDSEIYILKNIKRKKLDDIL